MIDAKTLGIVQLIGAVVAGYLGWQDASWGVLILAIVLLVTAGHHLTEETKKHPKN
jgi:hypothetical protein